jgi:thiosulfate dehydrogenase
MRARVIRASALLALLALAGVWILRATRSADAASALGKDTAEVTLCDGQTKVEFAADAPKTPESGQKIADALMKKWREKNPNVDWEAEELTHHTIAPAADNKDLVGSPQGATYGEISERDVLLWKTESERFVVAGSKVFHSGAELGSTIGVSCDMCHPDAANTHPETYPKYQVQLGRVVLLRDMINWCIEHPVRATPLAADDPRMRALEAYIYAQRKGAALNYGRR